MIRNITIKKQRIPLFGAVPVLIALLLGPPTRAQQLEIADAEQAIRQVASRFTDAFDRGDARAIASQFTADAVFINDQGQRFVGRSEIQKAYQTLLQRNSDLKLVSEIDSIRLINATTAIEEGRVAMMPRSADRPSVMSAYTALHTLQAGKWLMAHVRDVRVQPPAGAGQLTDLGVLVGNWAAEKGQSRFEVKTDWIQNNRFLARVHTITESNQITTSHLEIVGIDPASGQVTSWNFDSDGGTSVGVWLPIDQGWLVQSVGTTGKGVELVATNTLSHQGNDTLRWKSTDRFADGVRLGDINTLILKRQE